MSHRPRPGAAPLALLLAVGGVACDAVLGLDAPRLDPCAHQPCLDGASDADGVDGRVSGDGGSNGVDAGPVPGVRCGGGSPALGCAGGRPVCCLTLADGASSFACTADTASCDGTPIACATDNDCPGSEVCCHYTSAIKCEAQSVCPGASLVCDPAGTADQCPTGWTCSAKITSGGVTLPYETCEAP